MGIRLDNLPLRRYSKFYAAINDPTDPISSRVQLDLAAGYLRIAIRGLLVGQIRLSMPDEQTKQDVALKPYFVPGDRFFAIVNEYPEMIVEGDDFVTSDGKFNLGPLDEPYDWPSFEKKDLPTMKILFNGPDSLGDLLGEALSFATRDASQPTSGVFVKGGHIIGTDRVLFFDAHLEEVVPDIAIPARVWTALAALPNEGINIQFNDKSDIRVDSDDSTMKLIITQQPDLSAPDPSDEGFRSAFDHATKIVVGRQPLIDTLKFLENFTRFSQRNRFKIETPSVDILKFEIVDGAAATKTLPATVDPALVGDRFNWLSSKWLLRAVDALPKTDTVSIALDYDALAIDVAPVNLASGTYRHVVLTFLES
jgi:hypothetical protein